MSALTTLASGVWLMWTLALSTGLFAELWQLITARRWAGELRAAAGRVHQELWILAPPGMLLGTVTHWHSHAPWLIVFDALSMWNWWVYRNWPDENRWKRRGRKLRDKVAQRGGKLVVVPT